MKYFCTFNDEVGTGSTLLNAYEDLESRCGEFLHPEQCEFFKALIVSVNIKQETTITEIE